MGTHILITGARGKTGREVVRMLRDSSGVVVRSGTSRPVTEDDTVRFDWHDRATWAPAVAGADAVYLMRPDLPDAPHLVADVVDLAEDAHIVLLSEQGAEELAPDSWARRVETAVTEHAARWTLLRPSWFHQVLTRPPLLPRQCPLRGAAPAVWRAGHRLGRHPGHRRGGGGCPSVAGPAPRTGVHAHRTRIGSARRGRGSTLPRCGTSDSGGGPAARG
jgi:hypothetical protein